MEKPLEIKRIDLLVHPFWSKQFELKKFYNEEEAGKIFEIWKSHIDEAARDPHRLLFLCLAKKIPILGSKES
jgi:hypothetical protein